MKLIGSEISPYTRMVRILLNELGVQYEFEIVPPFAKMDQEHYERLTTYNPLRRIPALVHDDITLIESRVIMNYLLDCYDQNSQFSTDWRSQNDMSVIYGVLDAGILKFMLSVANPEMSKSVGYIDTLKQRIDRGLEFMERMDEIGNQFGLREIVLLCGLKWCLKRNIVDLTGFPRLALSITLFDGRPSVVETEIPPHF